jgi:hypothetical protein
MRQRSPRKPRFVVNHKVRVHSGTVSAGGVVVDLHEEGALIEGALRLAPGDTVSIRISGTEVKARVAWCEADAAGLTFEAPVAADLVADLHGETEGWITF